MRRICHAAAMMAALAASCSAMAAERGFITTDFDQIEVSGDMKVTVESGRANSVRATGTQRAIDRLIVEVRGKVLRIRPMAGGWGGWPGERPPSPSIRVIVPELRGAHAEGASQLFVAQLKGADARISQSGSAAVTIRQIVADKLRIDQRGSGAVTLQGKAHTVRAFILGSGALDAGKLMTTVLDLSSSSTGTVEIGGGRTALVRASGAGSVLVTGKPACTVRATGSGEVLCGERKPELFGGNQ